MDGHVAERSSASARPVREALVGAILVGLICLLYVLHWWNHYLSPMTGGDLFSMIAPEHGWLPYRDYYYQAPPGNILLLGWFGQIFGPKLVVPWAFGVVVKVAAAVALYCVLLRISGPFGAMLASTAAVVVGSGDMGDTPSWYFHQLAACITFGLLAFLVALERAVRAERVTSALFSAVAGLFIGWAFAVKQTSAPAILALLLAPLAVGALRPALRRWAAVSFGCVFAGMLAVLVPVAVWLARRGILRACIDQAFVHGPSSKGPLSTTLLRPLAGLVEYAPHRMPALAAVAVLAAMCVAVVRARRTGPETSASPIWRILAAGVACIAALVLGLRADWLQVDNRLPALVLSGVSSLGSFALVAFSTWRLRRHDSIETVARWVVLLVFGAFTYGATLGWAMGEVAAFPGLGVVLAVFWSGIRASRAHFTKSAAVFVVLSVLAYAAGRKAKLPCTLFWWGEPDLAGADYEPRAPELGGFRISKATALFYDDVGDIIQTHVHPGDEIFAFPNMQVFYAIARAKSPTLCMNHWFDICTDDVAIDDARRLRQHPPAVIIAMELPSLAYGAHEGFFRAGKPSGQRVLWETVMDLVSGYEKVAGFRSPGFGVPVRVWVRPRAEAAPASSAPSGH
jgi:hypothetical protein